MFILFWINLIPAFPQGKIEHPISIIHKGISLTQPVAASLIEVQDEKKVPLYYFMEVESVVCGDSVCRVDIVKLYWDTYARFMRLELPGEVELEKAEGKAFSEEDYQKLDRVLSNEHSPLNDLYSDQIVGTLASEGVDAVSRASVSINKKDYVEGAIWTCYSLWHWVHGDVKSIIRNLSADALSISQLTSLLSLEEVHLQLFSIEQLGRRKAYSEKILKLQLKSIAQHPELIEASLDYWEISADSVYLDALPKLIEIPQKEIRLTCLQSLFRSKHELSENFFLELPLSFEEMSYPEIQLFLRLLNKRAISSPKLNTKLIPLLDQEDFLIARGVYWFLADQELNEAQAKRLSDFYQRWKKKL